MYLLRNYTNSVKKNSISHSDLGRQNLLDSTPVSG